jgi:hypothetical protein
MSSNFQVGSNYSFTTLAPGVLGAGYQNAEVLGIVGYEIALTITDVVNLQRMVAPLLPAGSPLSYQDYQYVIFSVNNNASKLVLAEPWINTSSITINGGQVITAVVQNVTLSDVQIIQKELTALGYTNFSLTISTN